jgi:hypothetical protein
MGRDQRGTQDSLAGSFRTVMVLDCFGTDPFFGEEFDRGAEEVMKESPLMAIEVIEERDSGGVI